MSHLIDDPVLGENTFKSDKYDWSPPDFFPMKFTDPVARMLIRSWAEITKSRNPELSRDLLIACATAGGRAIKEKLIAGRDSKRDGVSGAGEAPTGGKLQRNK